ncbi:MULTISPECIES: putative T6SS immunity periplasmic lipoprotein [unclassified Cedecea]|uniref:putative T6SS immunity periplasmic lipoprotein n=1 Tax=unclassified Cedecea TaxID=2649846 RepID=UPI003018E3DE
MKNLMLVLIFLISGCVGDRLEFRNAGTVYQKNSNVICIKSKEGDVITYYLLTSSEDTYRQSLFFENYVQKKYPDHCFNLTLNKGVTYNLLFRMNNVKYRVNFALDDDGRIKQGVNNL